MRWVDGPIIDPSDRLAIENGILSGRELIRQRMRQRAEREPTPELLDWSREQFGILAYQQAKEAEALREHQCALWQTEPEVTEFDWPEHETGFDPALADFAAMATMVALACVVIYVLSRVLP